MSNKKVLSILTSLGFSGIDNNYVIIKFIEDRYRFYVMPYPKTNNMWRCMCVYLGEPIEKDDKLDMMEVPGIFKSRNEAEEKGINFIALFLKQTFKRT